MKLLFAFDQSTEVVTAEQTRIARLPERYQKDCAILSLVYTINKKIDKKGPAIVPAVDSDIIYLYRNYKCGKTIQ